MRKSTILLFLALMCVSVFAQNPKEEIANDVNLSASNYLAYPAPTQDTLTPAPNGYKPFYISTYQRHGSRYLTEQNNYDDPYFTLMKADSVAQLTQLGKDVLRRVTLLRHDANNRWGELTQLGAEQHRQIARRMYNRFPEVFEGKTYIDAKSTVVIRCILSMSNALREFALLNPLLTFKEDASYDDMYYMNYGNSHSEVYRASNKAYNAAKPFMSEHRKPTRLMNKLFKDSTYWQKNVDAGELFFDLFTLAANMQSMDLRHEITLYDIFTQDEIYNEWVAENAGWYASYGASPINNGAMPYSQSNLLRKIISEADTNIVKEHPGATLRYGHETMLLPLTCLLNINQAGMVETDLNKLTERGWVNYRIFPMGANIQFVFYHKAVGDKDVLFKVLLNENEATLPIKTDIAPYYHWNDFRDYYLKKLNTYKD